MPVELQPKLLRVLQEGCSTAGQRQSSGSSFRLISSTNRDPIKAINDGGLREDLYYRINTIEIRVPPLRERSMTSSISPNTFCASWPRSISDPYAEFLRNRTSDCSSIRGPVMCASCSMQSNAQCSLARAKASMYMPSLLDRQRRGP